jgi:hypothetical protein
MADIQDTKETWSWKKLLLGVFDGRNYGKAIVFGLCLSIIISVGYCVVLVVKSKFIKPTPVQTQSIGTNQGTVTTNNTTSSKEGKSWSLINLLCKN